MKRLTRYKARQAHLIDKATTLLETLAEYSRDKLN